MTKKMLNDIRYIDYRIKSKTRRLKVLRMRCQDAGLVSNYEKERVQSSGKDSDLLETVTDLEQEILNDICTLEALKKRAEKEFEELGGVYTVIMEMHYLEGYSFVEIARKVKHAVSTVYLKHGEAIEMLAKKEGGD